MLYSRHSGPTESFMGGKKGILLKKRFVRWVWDGQRRMCRIHCGLFQTWAFSHAFLTEIQTELHTNKCAMRFELSSVKWLQFTPFVPAPAWKWRESRWQVNGGPRPVTGRAVSPRRTYSRVLCLSVVSQSCRNHSTATQAGVRRISKNMFTFSKVKVIFYRTRLGPFFLFFNFFF